MHNSNILLKNTPKIKSIKCFEDRDLLLQQFGQLEMESSASMELSQARVHLFFCLYEEVNFQFSTHYARILKKNHCFILYNPERDLPVHFTTNEGGQLIHLSIQLDKLHQLFVPSAQAAPIFNPGLIQQKFYEERELNPELLMVINQIDHKSRDLEPNRLFFQAKILELLSLLFTESRQNIEMCPFLKNESTVRKIKSAKEMLLRHYKNPPTIPELAKNFQLNEFQLKAGFKEIYGVAPYHFLLSYKMELARQLLISENLQVKEVAHEIGYTNISHFIVAFKKQFGITPKKLQQKN